MTNRWTVRAVLTELIGAYMVGRGLSREKAGQSVRGRGTGRWGFSADGDLNYRP